MKKYVPSLEYFISEMAKSGVRLRTDFGNFVKDSYDDLIIDVDDQGRELAITSLEVECEETDDGESRTIHSNDGLLRKYNSSGYFDLELKISAIVSFLPTDEEKKKFTEENKGSNYMSEKELLLDMTYDKMTKIALPEFELYYCGYKKDVNSDHGGIGVLFKSFVQYVSGKKTVKARYVYNKPIPISVSDLNVDVADNKIMMNEIISDKINGNDQNWTKISKTSNMNSVKNNILANAISMNDDDFDKSDDDF